MQRYTNMKIKDLDIKKIKVPQGYKVIIDPELIEQERIAKEKADIQERLANTPEPSIEELAEFGKLYHPYYEDLRELEQLNG